MFDIQTECVTAASQGHSILASCVERKQNDWVLPSCCRGFILLSLYHKSSIPSGVSRGQLLTALTLSPSQSSH